MDKSSLGFLLCFVIQGRKMSQEFVGSFTYLSITGAFAFYDPECTGEDGQPLPDGSYPFPGECTSEYFNCLGGSYASTVN